MITGTKAEPIVPNQHYRPQDLFDKQGRPVKFGDMPDRTKGSWFTDLIGALFQPTQEAVPRQVQRRQPVEPAQSGSNLFWGQRSDLSKRIIIEQCEDAGSKMFGGDVKIDYEGGHTFVVNNYRLPPKWRRIPGVVDGTSPLAVVFPTDYPKRPPIGVYLKAAIAGAPNGHFYNQAYHDADKVMLNYGWKWYCVFVTAGCWKPARYTKPMDWRNGDNLWTYFTLIKEAFSTND